MIFVDTSVWIEALRAAGSAAAIHLIALLDSDQVALAAPVRVEILAGASSRDGPRLRRVLSALPVFFPTEQTWTRIDDWLLVARTAGERFGFADLLIAAIAADHDGQIWSFDSDFARMASIGIVSIYQA